jgi:7,8-dihydroneopterin aldolase/epimerase/oxygenase
MSVAEYTIALKGVRFFAFHGFYAEEKKTGNEFVIDLSVKYSPGNEPVDHINETVNYEGLFAILKGEMENPRQLLEMLAEAVVEKVHQKFSQVRAVNIQIEKLNPPITSYSGSVTVTYNKVFS